jgi:hypothetical protein
MATPTKRHRYPSQQPGYEFPYEKKGEPVLTYLPLGMRAELKKIAAARNTTMTALIVNSVTDLINEFYSKPSQPESAKKGSPPPGCIPR